MMKSVGLRLDPLDNLFFRDGKPFSAATKADSGLPNPQTLAGALRTALLTQHGFAFEKLRGRASTETALRDSGAPDNILKARFRGPWLALAQGNKIEPLMPVPATLSCPKQEKGKIWFRADPLTKGVPGWKGEFLPLWQREPDIEYPGGLLTPAGIKKFLDGGLPVPDDWIESGQLFGHQTRTGIAIDADSLSTIEGQIYAIRLLSLCQKLHEPSVHKGKDVCLYAEMIGESLELPDLMPFGGEGRYVRIERTKEAVKWPESGSAENCLYLLATPAFLGKVALPEVGSAKVRAAASGQPVAVSGWDIARGGPKPTRFAVPAGSVYFVEGNFEPKEQSLCTDDEDFAQGWGFALRGAWKS